MHERALAYCAQGKYEKALPFALRALHLLEWTVGPEHSVIVDVLNTVGEIYQEQGQSIWKAPQDMDLTIES